MASGYSAGQCSAEETSFFSLSLSQSGQVAGDHPINTV